MPNPSTYQALLEEQYADAVACANNLNFGKTAREHHLGRARALARELGIDGPPPVNGRPAEKPAPHQVYDFDEFDRALLVDGLRRALRSADRLEQFTAKREELIERLSK